MKNPDIDIYDEYMRGFNECPKHIYKPPDTELKRAAYSLGWDHYLIGDDVSSIDLLTWKETKAQIEQRVKRIRNGARNKA